MKYAIIGKGDFRGMSESREWICHSLEETLRRLNAFTTFEVYALKKTKTEASWKKMSQEYYVSKRENEERREYEKLKKKFG